MSFPLFRILVPMRNCSVLREYRVTAAASPRTGNCFNQLIRSSLSSLAGRPTITGAAGTILVPAVAKGAVGSFKSDRQLGWPDPYRLNARSVWPYTLEYGLVEFCFSSPFAGAQHVTTKAQMLTFCFSLFDSPSISIPRLAFLQYTRAEQLPPVASDEN